MTLALAHVPSDPRWLDPGKIDSWLAGARRSDAIRAREVLARARELHGLDPADAAVLLSCPDEDVEREMFAAARDVKHAIYGDRIVLFAPLYVSNLCSNDCQYCSFRTGHAGAARRALSRDQIAAEARQLLRMGHKRVLLVAGESDRGGSLEYVRDAIETVYAVREGGDAIRRINVNLAPLDVEGFRLLAASRIGTYQIFQETYHRSTYALAHPSGPKRDFDWRLGAPGRAMEGGIDDIGLGVLFGLYDHRWEVLALLEHARHLERTHGVGPHTLSVPRIEPAVGAPMSQAPPAPVSDREFRRIVAILRLAVPYTGLILSTRESAPMRAEAVALGISQASAASRTDPGGYGEDDAAVAQFQLGDHRSLDEVIRDLLRLGHVPSFCTACYRLGRTGGDFMDLAKPGLIRVFCEPNGILTFAEYLEDHASEETRRLAEAVVAERVAAVPEPRRRQLVERLDRIRAGERDLFF